MTRSTATAVLRELGSAAAPLTAAELSARLTTSPAIVRRALEQLETHQPPYVQRATTGDRLPLLRWELCK